MRRLIHARGFWLRFAVALLLLSLAIAGTIFWRARAALRRAKDAELAGLNLKFTVRPLLPAGDNGFEWVSAPSAFTAAAAFNGHIYVAGPAGLFDYDEGERPVRDFRAGRELPPAPLVGMARAVLADSREPELVIATRGAGLLAFNGSTFRQILPENRDARAITAILPTESGYLLIGTSKLGVLVYDGRQLTPLHPSLKQIHVTELAGSESDLWVGTLDRGVAHWHGGSADWFSENNGLPDARVFSIALSGTRAYVGGPAGIAEFEAGRFVRVLAQGAFVRSLFPREKAVLAGTMDDGILEIPLEQSLRNRQLDTSGDLAEVEQLFENNGSLYAVTASGIFLRTNGGGWKRALVPSGGLLTDRNVSALAVDQAGRLWVGYFDRGLDIVEGERARHIEDDRVFCVNRIRTNLLRGATAVATANGLVIFDAQGARRQALGKQEGLIADHVTDVAPFLDGMVIATPAGLTYMDAGGMRSLYAFHGLVNNHVYTVAANGGYVMAGTLGGISLLEGDQIRANYTTATSALKHNWITAALWDGGAWWVGTYGAGVARMNASGKFEAADGASGDLVINPNAMLATERVLLAGTMGHGLYVMNRTTGRWTAVSEGLPSLNVTALASSHAQVSSAFGSANLGHHSISLGHPGINVEHTGYIYVGTDNGLVRVPEQRLER